MDKNTILIIEDDTQIREIFCQIFSENGYNVFSAENGEYGIKMAKKILPELILCDILMPNIDGYEVKRKLSGDSSTENIPFIFVSSKSSPDDFKYGMKLGADDYITKPVKAKELLQVVSNRLKRLKSMQNQIENQKIIQNEKIMLKIDGVPTFVDKKNIVLITADGYYSILYLENGKKSLVKKSLKTWESVLTEKNFYRVHRNSIVNINFISSVEKWFKSTFKLNLKSFPEPVFVSQKYSKKLREEFLL